VAGSGEPAQDGQRRVAGDESHSDRRDKLPSSTFCPRKTRMSRVICSTGTTAGSVPVGGDDGRVTMEVCPYCRGCRARTMSSIRAFHATA
jgi:hypothetical protein